jgi:uncharacterized protein YjdB
MKLIYKKITKITVFLFLGCIFSFIFVSKLSADSDTAIPVTCSDSGTSIDPNTIIPKPQEIILGCDTANINSSWQVFANTSDEYENFTANYLITKIGETSSSTITPTLSNLANISNTDQIPDYSIIIGNPNQNSVVNALATAYGINFNDEVTEGFDQGYILLIKPKQILILADSTTGTFYGAISLTWLLKMNGNVIQLPETKITDWPDLDIRGWHDNNSYSKFSWDGDTIDSEEEMFDILARYKYNMWIGGIPAIYSDSTQDFKNRSLALKGYSRLRHFHITTDLTLKASITSLNPNYYEGFYSYNIPFEFDASDTLISSLSLDVDINNPGFENDSVGNSLPDYWRFSGNTSDQFWSWDCTQSYSGNCSAKLTFLEGSNGYSNNIYLKASDLNSSTISSYNLLPNRAYSLYFYTKMLHSGDEDPNPLLTITLNDSDGEALYSKSYNTNSNTSSWKRQDINFTTSHNEATMNISVRATTGSTLEFWVDDVTLVDMTDKLQGVITTPDSRLHIWNSDRTVEYSEGTDYTITDYGTKNAVYPYLADSMVIKRLEGGNISSLTNVKVDYDFAFSTNFISNSHNYQSLSDPYGIEDITTYRINPTMETLNPEYVFIAMDEIRGMNRDSRAQKRDLLNYQVLASYLNNIAGKIKLNNSDIKILAWDDMFSPFSNGGNDYQIQFCGESGKSWYALDLLDKNIIPISWYYDANDYLHKMTGSNQLYNKYGFNYMVAPWDTLTNIKWWSYLSNNSAAGLISTEWGILAMDTLINTANYSWNTIKSQSDPVSTENQEICDGIDNDGDNLYYSTSSYLNQLTWPSNIDENFDLQNDTFNCGSCGNICYTPHSYYSCVEGTCHFDGCFENFTDSNNSLSDGCEVSTIITPTSITISPSSLTLDVGSSAQLTKTVLPTNTTDKSIIWSSNNANIATINSSGLVTAQSAGQTTITVTSMVTQYVIGSITVTVNAIPTTTPTPTMTPTPTVTPTPTQITHIVQYSAEENGSLTGQLSQTVLDGENSQQISAIGDSGYSFLQWSDGVLNNPRSDIGVTGDINVSAEFTDARESMSGNLLNLENEVSRGFISFQGTGVTSVTSFTFNVNYSFGSGNAEVIFPALTSVNGNNGQNLDLTNFLVTDVSSETLNNRRDSLGALNLGISGHSLLFSNGVVIKIPINGQYNGQSLRVFSKNEGSLSWVYETNCVISEGYCTFQSTHATIFSVVSNPVSNSSSPSNGPPSTPTCGDRKPMILADLFQINTSNRSAKIYFTPITDTEKYYISFSEKPHAEEHGELVLLLKEGVQSHTIYYLKPNTTYYVKVRGQVGCMPGEWSNIMKFKTNSKGKIYYRYTKIGNIFKILK